MKSLHSLALTLFLLPALPAAQDESATSIRSGTKINATLESTVDASTAKPGDRVMAKVTKDVKQDHRTVVHKGDRLAGHVTSVESASKAKSGSQMGVVFDQLVRGDSSTQLNAVLSSVVSTSSSQQAQSEPLSSELPMASPTGRSRSTSGGGGLGGVTSAVSSTAGIAGSATGSLGAGMEGTATSAGSGLSSPLRSIHVDTVLSGQQETAANSVLSTNQGTLRLDSGTALQFTVAGEAGDQSHSKQK